MRDVRLPKTWIPERYNVTLLPNLKTDNGDWSYPGSVEIALRASNETEGNERIFLHAKGLTIDEESVVVEDSEGNQKAIDGTYYLGHKIEFILNIILRVRL